MKIDLMNYQCVKNARLPMPMPMPMPMLKATLKAMAMALFTLWIGASSVVANAAKDSPKSTAKSVPKSVPTSVPTSAAKSVAQGALIGTKNVVHPDWFKESFLDFAEDIDEAAAVGKRLVLYFWQEGCPYCNQLWEHNMAVPAIEKTFRENFEVVAINIWGDREIIAVGGKEYSEKQLAKALDIDYTPTLIFYTEAKQPALRLNGYYPPTTFAAALDYVRERREAKQSFAAYRAAAIAAGGVKQDLAYTQPYFKPAAQLSDLLNPASDSALNDNDKPLMVLFEVPDCPPCAVFHQQTLADKDSAALLQQLNVIQLNALDNTRNYALNGAQKTAAEWADELGIAYYPSLVFFDAKGNYLMQIDSALRTFHIQSALAYIVEGAFLQEPNFQRYIGNRAEHLRAQGINVDIGRY